MDESHYHEQFRHMYTEPKKATRSKKKAPVTKETSQSIAEQTSAFLKAGGQITKLQIGVSRQTAYSGAGKKRGSPGQ